MRFISYKKSVRNILICITCLSIFYAIEFYFNFFQSKLTVENGKVVFPNLPNSTFTSNYTSKYNFSDMPISEISNININLLGNNISNISIIEKSQRYYIPLEAICQSLNYSLSMNCSNYIIYNTNHTYNLTNSKCNIDGLDYILRGSLLNYNNSIYISISDIEYIFNLTAIFDSENQTISLVNGLSNINNSTTQPTNGTAALIRLEDFSADSTMLTSDTQIKFKIIGNFLRSFDIKYHITWVPRYKNPSEDIDNNLLESNTFENAGFINLLDYLINTGAEIGLHGYTHQHSDETSLAGVELSNIVNNSEIETRSVIENAIDVATALNIPYTFFESSHYKATSKEKKIISEYVQYLYEPMNYLIYNKLQPSGNNMYIPTPLSYVKDLDVSYILKQLKNPRPGELESLFYHPSKELPFINYNIDNNSLAFSYSPDSPLQQIINCINENNYVTIHVSDLHN